jgi:hypothetical protein
VAGRRSCAQDGSVIDAIEQAHAKDLTGAYPNGGRNARSIAVVPVGEAKSVAILTDFELKRLNSALNAGHLRRILKSCRGRAAPQWR